MDGEELQRRWRSMREAGLVGSDAPEPTLEDFREIAGRLAPVLAGPVPPDLAARVRRILVSGRRPRTSGPT
jgi:hypothetical protein